MWLVVKKGKKFNEKLIINQNQIKLITEPKLRYTSIEEDRKTLVNGGITGILKKALLCR